MTHTQLIAYMVKLGVPTSPYMNYWTLTELCRYASTHKGQQTTPSPLFEGSYSPSEPFAEGSCASA